KYGVDIKQLKQIAVGARAVPGSKEGNFYAIVTGGFDRERLLAGIASNPDKVSMESENYGDRTLYILTSKEKPKQPGSESRLDLPVNQKIDKLGLAFLNQGMVVVGNIDGVKNTLDVQNGKHPSVLSNQKLSGYLSGLNTSAMIRFAGVAPSKAKFEADKKGDSSQKKKVLTNDELGGSSKSQS